MPVATSRAEDTPLRISSGNSGSVAMAFNSSRLFITLLQIGLHEITTIGSDRSWRPTHDGLMERVVDPQVMDCG
jgi:hypothetical protein